MTWNGRTLCRQALLLVHGYVVENDGSHLAYFGLGLGIEEALSAPWTRDDLAWALRLLADRRAAVSDAPFWVPALIAAALEPPELDGLEDQPAAAFEDLHDHLWLPADGLGRLARLYGTALSRFNNGVPGDLLMAARHARTHNADLQRLLADPEVHQVFRFASGLTKPGTGSQRMTFHNGSVGIGLRFGRRPAR